MNEDEKNAREWKETKAREGASRMENNANERGE